MIPTDLPEAEVFVKISKCSKCKGIVRAAVKHMMSKKSINEFAKEVMEHNLSVSEIRLFKYRKLVSKPNTWCSCETQQPPIDKT